MSRGIIECGVLLRTEEVFRVQNFYAEAFRSSDKAAEGGWLKFAGQAVLRIDDDRRDQRRTSPVSFRENSVKVFGHLTSNCLPGAAVRVRNITVAEKRSGRGGLQDAIDGDVEIEGRTFPELKLVQRSGIGR